MENDATTTPTLSAAAPQAPAAPRHGGPGTIPAELLARVQRPKLDSRGRVVTEEVKRKQGGETVIETVPVMRAIKPSEVLAWREYDDRVVVVTQDGQKFVGAK